MALFINRDITVLGDINLSQLYVRLTVDYGPSGTPIKVKAFPYSSKVAYENDERLNAFHVEGIPYEKSFTYNRLSDGSDILFFAHNKLKEYLCTEETEKQPIKDPSTNSYKLDEDGKVIYEDVVIKPIFAMDSSILISDL